MDRERMAQRPVLSMAQVAEANSGSSVPRSDGRDPTMMLPLLAD